LKSARIRVRARVSVRARSYIVSISNPNPNPNPMFQVQIFDYDVTSNLKFCHTSFLEKSNIKAVTQLQSIIRGMRNSGSLMQRDHPQQLLQQCLQSVLDLIKQGAIFLDESKEKERESKERYAEKARLEESEKRERSDSNSSFNTENKDDVKEEREREKELNRYPSKEEEAAVRQISRIQIEAYDTLCAVKENGIAWGMLSG
jgi:hypothetical protein